MNDDRELAILQVAEEMVRRGGYNSFSFRNIATQVGIKSSSVHYHFSTKEDLGVAVAKYYTDKFLATLGSPQELVAAAKDPVKVYIKAFRQELHADNGMCLCGMLGAETSSLPKRVLEETRQFFTRNIDWLEEAYSAVGQKSNCRNKAIQTISLLEGAMLTSHVLSDAKAFDIATKLLDR